MSVASYEAVIKLIVQGEDALKRIQERVDKLYKTIDDLQTKQKYAGSQAAVSFVREQAQELEKVVAISKDIIKQDERRLVQQSKLNAAVDLYERRLKQTVNSGAAELKKFSGQIAEIEAAFSYFKDKGNVKAVQALATELGRMVEYSNNVNRNERARVANQAKVFQYAKQITAYEERGLDVARARAKQAKFAEVAGTNQLNEAKKYSEAVERQLRLLREQELLQKRVAAETSQVQASLAKLNQQQAALENSRLDAKALQIQQALDKQAAAAAETAAQTEKLSRRQAEFIERTNAAAQASARQTAEFYRQQRIAKEVAKINAAAPTPQLLLAPAAPGAPAMSGGARSLITGPVERLGGARTQDQADTALRFAQALKEQVRPLSQIDALYAGIAKEAGRLQQIKALPDTAMLNAAARGITTLETAQDRYNRELGESAARLQQLDRLEESRTRRAAKLRQIQEYYAAPSAMEDAGFGVQGPRPPAPRPAGGNQGLMARPGVADALIGGSFPLLFGGGPGAAAGGFAGGLIGGAMGGPAGMALSLALSVVGQQIDAAIKQIRDMQLALDGLNIDKLRESFVFVNAALDTTVRRLIEAGKYDQARAAIAAEVALQTGASTEATKSSANAAIGLSNSWSKLVGSLSATVGIVAGPLAAGLAVIIEGVNLVVVGLNTVVSLIGGGIKRGIEAILRLLPGGEQLIKNLEVAVRGVTEEEAKLAAEIIEITDKQQRQIEYNQKLLGLEKQRTLGRTTAEKQINALIDSQVAREQIRQEYETKALDLRRKAAAATTTEAQQAANTAILQNEALQAQALKHQDIKDLLVQQGLEIEKNAQKYADAAVAINQQIDALERADAVRQSSFQAEAALNDLYGAQLDRQYRLATTAQQRYDIAIAQFYQQVKAAEIEYQQTLASNEILKQKAVLQAQLVELKYQELVAEKEIAIAQAGARGNTPEQISDISDAYDKGIQAQAKAVGIATAQVKATNKIVENQNAVAKAILQTKLLKTEEALAQKLVTAEIGLSEQAANLLATRLRESVQQTILAQGEGTKLVGVIQVGASKASIFANAMTQVAVAADTAAYNIRRAFIEQQNLNAARGAQSAAAPAAVTGAADGAYWPGGFKAFADGGVVSRPTLGLIGEGGEPEYVIPSSKMNAAMARYASGKRGESVIPQAAGDTSGSTERTAPMALQTASDTSGSSDYAPSINPMINVTTGPVMNMNGSNYVSQRDFIAGMQAASRRGAEMALSAMRNNGTIRRVVGAR